PRPSSYSSTCLHRATTPRHLPSFPTPTLFRSPYDVGLPNHRGFGNVIYDSGDYPAVLRRALEMSGWDRLTKECLRARQEGRLLGVGLACYVELTGVGPFEGATIRADSAGRITVFTGVPSQGQGLETTL